MLVMMVKVVFRIAPPDSVSLEIESITDRKMPFGTQVLLIMRHLELLCAPHIHSFTLKVAVKVDLYQKSYQTMINVLEH